MRPKKTYQVCLDTHESFVIEELAKRVNCSTSALLRHAAKELIKEYKKLQAEAGIGGND